jgi:hypothetical protein
MIEKVAPGPHKARRESLARLAPQKIDSALFLGRSRGMAKVDRVIIIHFVREILVGGQALTRMQR